MNTETVKPKVVEGAYSWIFTPNGESSVFLGLPEEDLVKEERVPGHFDWTTLLPGMFALISGKREGEENASQTIQREALEEQRILVNLLAITNTFPEIILEQRTGGKYMVVHGTGHKFRLTAEQLVWFQNGQDKIPVEVISHGTLAQFLIDQGDNLRPFVRVVAHQIWRQGLLYQG